MSPKHSQCGGGKPALSSLSLASAKASSASVKHLEAAFGSAAPEDSLADP